MTAEDKKITALTEKATLAATDYLVIEDRATPEVPETKFIQSETLRDFVNPQTRYAYISAKALHPSITAGCASLSTQEMSTNKQVIEYLAFDASTDENAEIEIVMPPTWDGGVIYCTPYWTHPATTTNFKVSWGFKGRAYANDDAMDQAFGTAVTSYDTGGTTYDHYAGPETTAITLAGTPAGGQSIILRVYRDADDATNDTLAVDAWLKGFMLRYTVS